MENFKYIGMVLCLFYSFLLVGQNDWTMEKAKKLAGSAHELAEDGQWGEALAVLDENIAALEAKEDLASYRAFFLFSKGYLYQRYPVILDDTIAPNVNLRRSQATYEQALLSQPNDVKILNNLILVSLSLEDWTKAETYANTALQEDTNNPNKWHIVLGDIYQRKGDLGASWASYSNALDEIPDDRNAAKKMLGLYRNYGYEDLGALFDKCHAFNENGMPEMALQGLEFMMTVECELHSEVPEDVLLFWSGILAANNWVRPRLEKQLEKLQCAFEPLTDLRNNIREAWDLDQGGSSWWRSNERRHFYYLALQKHWADYLLSRGAKSRALDLYRDCKERLDYVDDFSVDIYDKKYFLEMEVLIQLARLYGDRELNPNLNQFDRFEDEIYYEKSRAYNVGDLESIQKFHTVLGIIYVGLEKWKGGFAGNAEFQLTRALLTAERRVEEDPTVYVPLPHLHQHLGDTYSAIRNERKAVAAYLDAAIGYLETDNLPLSFDMIEKVDSFVQITENASILEKLADVQLIYRTREMIPDLDSSSFNPNSEDYFWKNPDNNWLNEPDRIRFIDPNIVERQTFKVFADLSKKARDERAGSESRSLEDTATERLEAIAVLSSKQDIIRIKQLGLPDKILEGKKPK